MTMLLPGLGSSPFSSILWDWAVNSKSVTIAVPNSYKSVDLSENLQPSHSKPSPHFLEIPKSI